MSTVQCPFCQGTDALFLNNSDSISRKYEKVERTANQPCTTTGFYHYTITKYVCLVCGRVFEQLSDSALDVIKKEREYWV